VCGRARAALLGSDLCSCGAGAGECGWGCPFRMQWGASVLPGWGGSQGARMPFCVRFHCPGARRSAYVRLRARVRPGRPFFGGLLLVVVRSALEAMLLVSCPWGGPELCAAGIRLAGVGGGGWGVGGGVGGWGVGVGVGGGGGGMG